MIRPSPPDRRPRTQRRAARRTGRLLRGSSAAVLLAALVVGVPWALARFVGWPLPDRMPTAAELQLHLFGPLSSGLLLDVLACACWLAWAAFTLDVTRCTATMLAQGAAGVRASTRRLRRSPTHALAALLVGAVALSILGNRVAPREHHSATAPWPAAAAASSARPGPLVPIAFAVPDDAHSDRSAPGDNGPDDSGTDPAPAPASSVIVRAPDPVTGVHDSLWRIADRALGSGARWPEIFEINRGKPQPGGGTFTRPSLIFPGEELVLPPVDAGEVPDQRPPADAAVPFPPPATEPSLPAGPPAPATNPGRPPADPAVADGRADHSGGAPVLAWDPAAFAGIGLAAAVSAALLTVRRRHRRGYRPGSGRRHDLPAAPEVYQLRLAHLRADEADPDEPGPGHVLGADVAPAWDEDDETEDADGDRPGPAAAGTPAPSDDSERIALAAASSRGLGLTGPGAPGALRALLLTLLADVIGGDVDEPGPAVRLLVTRDDLVGVLGSIPDLTALEVPALEMHATLDGALDVLESESVARAAHPRAGHREPMLVLVARPGGDHARLQAILDNGSEVGVTALLLGQWRSGGTVHVRRDGTVTATGPGPVAALRGNRLLTLDLDATGRILDLLQDAAGDHPAAGSAVDAGPDTAGAGAEDALEIGSSPAEGQDPASSPAMPAVPHPRENDDRPAEQRPQVLPVRLVLLGPPRVLWRPRRNPDGPASEEPEEVEITGRLQPRTRELLVHLALHPDGAGRESVAAALWPDSAPDRTTNAVNTALTRLRQTLTRITAGEVGDIVRHGDGRLGLNPDLVDVDYWRFDAAVTARRAAATDEERADADQLVVDAYGGELAEGTPYPWIEIAREAVRRDAIDSAAALARALVPRDPQRTLDLLEIARAFDPVNEMLYRDIMRLQSRLGRPDAISRTLALLTARLGDLGDRPHDDTIDLARRLQRRGSVDGAVDSGDVPADSATRAG